MWLLDDDHIRCFDDECVLMKKENLHHGWRRSHFQQLNRLAPDPQYFTSLQITMVKCKDEQCCESKACAQFTSGQLISSRQYEYGQFQFYFESPYSKCNYF